MQNILLKPALLVLLLISFFYADAQQSISGNISDKNKGTTLPGAGIYIPDLKTGTSSDIDGNFKINNLPKGKFLIQITYIGYKPISQFVETTADQKLKFMLEPTSIEAREIVITGSPVATENDRNSVHVTLMDRKEMLALPAGNIIDAIAHTPGVSQVTTGSAVSKPVIRGLGGNRIITLHDGVRQEGQQWGEEHGIEIDKFAAEKVEVLRGPSSLIYGSDALGGVINIIEPIPAEPGSLAGSFDSQFADNGPYLGNSVMLQGNHKGFHARVRASFVHAGDIQTPSTILENTGYREQNFNSNLGVNRKWGYTHLNISSYDALIGFYEPGNRFESHRIPLGLAHADPGQVESTLNGIGLPLQKVAHQRINSSSRFILGKNQLELNAGLQLNNRKEFESSIHTPALFMDLQTYTLDAKFHFEEKNGLEKVIGISGMMQENKNKADELLIPDYSLNDKGGFFYIKKTHKKIAVNAGIRYDDRNINSFAHYEQNDLGETDTLFKSLNRNYNALTGALGFAYKADENWLIRANIGRGFRAPNLSELRSNGVHEGTQQYEIGEDRLRSETSLQFDLGLEYSSDKVNIDMSMFSNSIDGYTYSRNIGEEFFYDGVDTLTVYRYTQGFASLIGFEFSADIHFTKALHLENAFSYVYAQNLTSNRPLPLIPAFQIHNEIRYDLELAKIKWMRESFISFGVDNHLSQNRTGLNETSSPGYSLINAGLGTTFHFKKQEISLSISGKNLANISYADHLNRLRNIGGLNPGRILFVSLNVPFKMKGEH